MPNIILFEIGLRVGVGDCVGVGLGVSVGVAVGTSLGTVVGTISFVFLLSEFDFEIVSVYTDIAEKISVAKIRRIKNACFESLGREINE